MEEIAPSSPPPVRYVNLLIYTMVKSNELSVTIRSSEPLPPVRSVDGDVPSTSFAEASNRLKVMSGLRPIRYEEPVDGTFQMFVRGVPGWVRTHFEDDADDPCCRVDIVMDDS